MVIFVLPLKTMETCHFARPDLAEVASTSWKILEAYYSTTMEEEGHNSRKIDGLICGWLLNNEFIVVLLPCLINLCRLSCKMCSLL